MATESVETVPSSGDSLEEKASFPTAGTLRPPSMRVRGASRPSVEAAVIHERTLMDSLTSPTLTPSATVRWSLPPQAKLKGAGGAATAEAGCR